MFFQFLFLKITSRKGLPGESFLSSCKYSLIVYSFLSRLNFFSSVLSNSVLHKLLNSIVSTQKHHALEFKLLLLKLSEDKYVNILLNELIGSCLLIIEMNLFAQESDVRNKLIFIFHFNLLFSSFIRFMLFQLISQIMLIQFAFQEINFIELFSELSDIIFFFNLSSSSRFQNKSSSQLLKKNLSKALKDCFSILLLYILAFSLHR